MKKFLKFFMFFSFILILALTGCPTSTSDEDPPPEGFTITGLKDYEGQYVIAISLFVGTNKLSGFIDVDKDFLIGGKILDGKVNLNLSADFINKYTGNDKDVDLLVVIQKSNDKFNIEDDTIFSSIAGKVNASFKDGAGEGKFVPNSGLIVFVPNSEYQGNYTIAVSDNVPGLIASGDKNASDIEFNIITLVPFDGTIKTAGGLVKNGFTLLNLYITEDFINADKYKGDDAIDFRIYFKDVPEFDQDDMFDSVPKGILSVNFKNGIGAAFLN